MPSIETILAGMMMISLTFYALMGGADYGGGVWDLLAWGPRKKAQRELIAKAIGPIWEANHVWLILVIVILFTAFPPAFAAISTALHIPLVLMLSGIVLRGSAFIFRSYDKKTDAVQSGWGLIFSIASLMTPVLLGIMVGALSSGTTQFKDDLLLSGFVNSWFALFPFAVGFFALTLFAFLAAVYLTVEASAAELQDDFRWRAFIAGAFAGLMALIVYLLSENGAPVIRHNLSASWWTWPLQIATATVALYTMIALWQRRFRLARFCAALQVTLILWGWGNAQFPYLVVADFTIYNSAAPPVALRLIFIALTLGALLLFPSFYYLYRVFKSHEP